jgi:CRP/FNR family transcriptional regulator, cyclic AMP receptor protein
LHIKHLQKGDLLIKEGDASQAMYWVQSGTLRLFKKKGAGFIELGVVHSGEVVGELSFLDNEKRSASVEAMQTCDIVEIPRGNFDEFLNAQPAWMKSLLMTLVKRLRATSNKVRELETASTVYTKDEDGNATKQHEFLSTREIVRLCQAFVLAASRHGEKQTDGSIKLRAGWLQLHAGNILGIQLAKVTAFSDVLSDAGVVRIDKQKDHVDLYIPNLDLIERFMLWSHEENVKPDDKQTNLSPKAMAIVEGITKFGNLPKSSAEEKFTVNMADVYDKMAVDRGVKSPFEWPTFGELVSAGLSQEVRQASEREKSAELHLQKFLRLAPSLMLRERFRVLNEQKRA